MGRDSSSSIEVSPIGGFLSSNLDNTTTNGLPCVCGKAMLAGPTITRFPEPSRGDSEQVTGGASSKVSATCDQPLAWGACDSFREGACTRSRSYTATTT